MEMNEIEKTGFDLMVRYNRLKKRLDRTTVALIALRDSGGPKERTEHAPDAGRRVGCISTESLIREILRVSKQRREILEEMCEIEGKIERLPHRLMRLLQWRYILKAKREPIARRLEVSLRHYSRLKRQALYALGEICLQEAALKEGV
jgi:hypothetical protein